MFSTIWHTFFFDPVYNALVYFIGVLPGGDVGFAIILVTVVVKIILIPLSLKSARTQHAMRAIEEDLTKIKEKYKKDREKIAKETMRLYKEAGINPFATIFLLFIQLPFIIAIYFSVWSGGGVRLPEINTDLLYSFVAVPQAVNMMLLGMVDIASKNIPLALLAGATQFLFGILSLPKPKPKTSSTPNLKEDLGRSMNMNMRYVMPIVIIFIAYTFSGAIALYFVVSNLMSIAQEFVVRKQIPNRHEVKKETLKNEQET